MIKKGIIYTLKNVGVSLVLAFGVAIVTALLLAMIFLGLFKSVIALSVVCAVAGIIVGIGGDYFTIGKGLNPKEMYADSDYKKMAESGKPAKYKHFCWAMVPTFVIGCVVAVVAVFCVIEVERTIDYDGFGLEEVAILPAILSAVATYNIVSFFSCIKTAKRYACPECGCILNWEKTKDLSFTSGERTKTKTSDTYGKVGEVYYDGEKIGDLKGNTGYTTTTTVTSYSISESLYRCKRCGLSKEFTRYDEYVKDKYREHTSYYK